MSRSNLSFHKEFWEDRIRRGARGSGHWKYSMLANEYIYRIRETYIGKVLSPLKSADPQLSGKLLDAGAGNGRLSGFFHNLGFRVLALEVTTVGCRMIKDRLGHKVDVIQASITALPLRERSIAISSAIDVLYHLVEDVWWEEAVKELWRVLRKEGCLLWTEGRRTQQKGHVKFRAIDRYLEALPDGRLFAVEKLLTIFSSKVPILALIGWLFPGPSFWLETKLGSRSSYAASTVLAALRKVGDD